MGASPLVRGYGRVAELRACLTARKAPGPAIPLSSHRAVQKIKRVNSSRAPDHDRTLIERMN